MNGEDDQPMLLTAADVATISKLSERTIRRWIRSGWLESVRIGRAGTVTPVDLLAFLESNADSWHRLGHGSADPPAA
jgi:hypothetical protein